MRLHSLELTDLHLLNYQPAWSRSEKMKMNVADQRAMVVSERLTAGFRRGRSWDACMLAGKNNDALTLTAEQKSCTCVTT